MFTMWAFIALVVILGIVLAFREYRWRRQWAAILSDWEEGRVVLDARDGSEPIELWTARALTDIFNDTLDSEL